MKNLRKRMVENQAVALTQYAVDYYETQLTGIMLARFKWHNLPAGVTNVLMEEAICHGSAVFLKPENSLNENKFAILNYSNHGTLNIYGETVTGTAIALNGFNQKFVNNLTGNIIYNNALKRSDHLYIELFARRLAEIDRIREVNLNNQKMPMLIVAPEEKQHELQTMYKQIDEGQPAIFAHSSFGTNFEMSAINAGVPFIGDKLNYDKQQILNEFMTYLGVKNSGVEKQERMTSDEIQLVNEMTVFRRLDYLEPRREAAERINKLYDLNIFVTWNDDIESENYKTLTKIGETDNVA